MAKLGQKSVRGQPELYNEVKSCFSVALTRTGVEKLDTLARSVKLSRSELIEQIARGRIRITVEQPEDCS